MNIKFDKAILTRGQKKTLSWIEAQIAGISTYGVFNFTLWKLPFDQKKFECEIESKYEGVEKIQITGSLEDISQRLAGVILGMRISSARLITRGIMTP